MAENLAPPPKSPLERDQKTGALINAFTTVFQQWLLSLTTRLQNSPTAVASAVATLQTTSIGATTINTQALRAGRYRLTYYARVTQPATTSSSLTVTFGWTESGISCAASGTAITGNLPTSAGSATITIRADTATLLTFSTTYVSVGATAMQYRLDVIAESLP